MIKVYINDHDMFEEFGLFMTDREIGAAEPNLYKQTVPGKNGDLDYTSFFGDITFKNRIIKITLSNKSDINTQELKYSLEMLFNGQEVNLIFSDDEDNYYKGRLTFESNDDDTKIYDLKMKLDAYPFKFKKSDNSEVK